MVQAKNSLPLGSLYSRRRIQTVNSKLVKRIGSAKCMEDNKAEKDKKRISWI